VPAEHSAHALDPATLTEPTAQPTQADPSAFSRSGGAHASAMQTPTWPASAADASSCSPAGHVKALVVHCPALDAPAASVEEPFGHAVQLAGDVAAVVGENVDIGHRAHVAEDAPDHAPGAHAAHSAAPALEEKPLAHAEQAPTEVAPVPLYAVPAGQGRQPLALAPSTGL